MRHHRLASLRLVLCLGLSGLVATAACSERRDGQNPEGVVRLLIAAARTGDRAGVYQWLGPATRARIENLAEAARKSGSRTTMKPEDFLSVGWALPTWEPDGMRTIRRTDDDAEVEVHSATGDRNSVNLVREGTAWKIELPDR